MLGQYKINGLRCIITAYAQNDMFKPTRLRFQSREGITWHTLGYLEDYLLSVIPTNVIGDMIDGYVALDGEIYLPGHSINEINHFVKDPNCLENKLLQFWCYDIMMEGNQTNRNCYRYHIHIPTLFADINTHLNNKERLIILPHRIVSTDNEAIEARNHYINIGLKVLYYVIQILIINTVVVELIIWKSLKILLKEILLLLIFIKKRSEIYLFFFVEMILIMKLLKLD